MTFKWAKVVERPFKCVRDFSANLVLFREQFWAEFLLQARWGDRDQMYSHAWKLSEHKANKYMKHWFSDIGAAERK